MGAFRVSPTQCCGIYELVDISGLGSPEEVIKEASLLMAIRTDCYSSNPAFLMFSGVIGTRKRVYHTMYHADRNDDYGQALADYITEQKLGTVTGTEPARNHSGNMIRVWLWAPQWEALKEIWEKTQAARAPVPPPSLAVAPLMIQGNSAAFDTLTTTGNSL